MRTQQDQPDSDAPSSLEQLAETLAGSEARNRAILEAAVDSIITIDERGLIQSINSATTKTFGYQAAELLNQNISMLMPLPFSAEHDGYLAHYLKTGTKRIIGIGREVLGKRKDGSIFPMELSVSEVQLVGKRLFTGIIRDITYRKQVEEALLFERNRIQQYFDVAVVIIVSLDPDGRVQSLNRTATELLQLQEDETLGLTLAELLPGEKSFLEGLAQAVASGTAHKWDSSLHRGETDQVISWHSAPLIQRDGKPSGLLLSGSVVTDQVRAQQSLAEAHYQLEGRVKERTEELRKTNEELRNSLREKEVLLKEIHHRVKNNLQLISSLLSLQVRSRKGMTIDQLVYEIQGRIQSIALLHEMLYQSGDLVHIDFGKYLNTLAQTIVRYYEMTSRVALDIQADEVKLSLDGSIYCGLLLNELITNSMKHAFPDGRTGTLSIAVKRCEGAKVLLSVADDGVGLPADFDITQATSLGLELVQQLTAKLGGELTISREGGSGFQLLFYNGV